MDLLKFIDIYSQFIQYVIFHNIVQFNKIINLSQTCKTMNKYFHTKLKTYSLLCQYNIKRIDYDIFRNTDNFYINSFEKQLFQNIYAFQKNMPNIDKAAENGNIVTLKWYSDPFIESNGKPLKKLTLYENSNPVTFYNVTPLMLRYTVIGMNRAAANGYINVLDWFCNISIQLNLPILYNSDAIDDAASNGHIHVLDWFLNHAIKYEQEKIKSCPKLFINFSHTEMSTSKSSKHNYINVLDWFLNQSLRYPDIIKFKYSSNAIDFAASQGFIHILEWFYKVCKEYNLKFKYTVHAIHLASRRGHTNVLDWFYNKSSRAYYLEESNNGSFHKHIQPFEFVYMYNTIDYTSAFGFVEVLDWYFNRSIERMKIAKTYMEVIAQSDLYPLALSFKYSRFAINEAIKKSNFVILEWFYNKYVEFDINFNYTFSILTKADITVIEWLFNHSKYRNLKKYPKKIKFNYTSSIISKAIKNENIELLNWLYNKNINYKLPFKYPKHAFERTDNYIISNWWKIRKSSIKR